MDRPGASGSQSTLAESLPPSIRSLLDTVGALAAVEAEGFMPNRGNTVWWRGEHRIEEFPGEDTGYHVHRRRFDQVLKTVALNEGARFVEAEARIDSDGVVRVHRGGGPGTRLQPRWTLDCTGRTGLLARSHRVPEEGTSTLAILGRYEADHWADLDPTHAWVEDHSLGWLWSVPTSATERHFAAMIDPGVGFDPASTRDLGRTMDRVLAEAPHIGAAVREATPLGEPWACAASMYGTSRCGGDGWLLVGDAVSFVDPMSSFGVKKALASAWLAAVAVHTAVEDPSMTDSVVEFYSRRELEMYSALRGHMALHVDERAREGQPFWESRGRWSEGLPTAQPSDAGTEGLGSDSEIREAFRALKASTGPLRAGRTRLIDRPRVVGNRIRQDPALVTRRFPEGIRALRQVDLVTLAEAAPGCENPGALYEAMVSRSDSPDVSLPDFLGALAFLLAEGVLEL